MRDPFQLGNQQQRVDKYMPMFILPLTKCSISLSVINNCLRLKSISFPEVDIVWHRFRLGRLITIWGVRQGDMSVKEGYAVSSLSYNVVMAGSISVQGRDQGADLRAQIDHSRIIHYLLCVTGRAELPIGRDKAPGQTHRAPSTAQAGLSRGAAGSLVGKDRILLLLLGVNDTLL